MDTDRYANSNAVSIRRLGWKVIGMIYLPVCNVIWCDRVGIEIPRPM
jgi:hypothetical protein